MTANKNKETIIRLLDEYRNDKDDEIYNEILLELERGVDDIMLLIQNLDRKKQIGIKENAQFIEMSHLTSDPGVVKRLAVIRVGLMASKRGTIGQYQVLWNKHHPCNYGGECAAGNITLENTALTAIITLLAGCAKMRVRDIALYFANDSARETFQNLESLAKDPKKISPLLLKEFKKIRSKGGLRIMVIEDKIMKHATSRYGKVDDWWLIE